MIDKKAFGKKLKLTILIILLLIVWFIIIQIFSANKYVALVKVVEGESKVGINPLADKLDFGDLSRNSQAKRFIKLTNQGQFRVFVMSFQFGEISELLEVNKNFFTILPTESQQIEYKINIPPSAPVKTYKGYVWLFKIPIFF